MAHPHEKHIKHHRHEKHHKLGVHGEHPDEKAERLACGGSSGMARGGRQDALPKAFLSHIKHRGQ